MDYNGGYIYTSYPKLGFRAIRTKGKYATERFVSWGGDEPTQKAWEQALKLIDEARAAGD